MEKPITSKQSVGVPGAAGGSHNSAFPGTNGLAHGASAPTPSDGSTSPIAPRITNGETGPLPATVASHQETWQLDEVRNAVLQINHGIGDIASALKEYISKVPAKSEEDAKLKTVSFVDAPPQSLTAEEPDPFNDQGPLPDGGTDSYGHEAGRTEDDPFSFRSRYSSTGYPHSTDPFPYPAEPAAKGPEAEETDLQLLEFPTNTVAKVKDCNWDQFENHVQGDDDSCAIEVLKSALNCAPGPEAASHKVKFKGAHGDKDKACASHEIPTGVSDACIRRVRIQSEAILNMLSGFSEHGSTWTHRPHTFKRPFRYFTYFQPQVKAEITKLESQLEEANAVDLEDSNDEEEDEKKADADEKKADTATATPSKPTTDDATKDEGIRNASTSENSDTNSDEHVGKEQTEEETNAKKKADKVAAINKKEQELEQIRLYYAFVDKRIMPPTRQFVELTSEKKRTIRYQDLSYLFKSGELVYAPKLSDEDDIRTSSGRQSLWRVYQIVGPEVRVPKNCACCFTTCEEWTINCYYLEFNGRAYGAITKSFSVKAFENEREITSLPVYPLRFASDSDSVLQAAMSNGDTYVNQVARKHGSYSGWTLIKDPVGNPLKNPNTEDKIMRSPEHIDSEVLIDFEEAFNHCPPWKPLFTDESPVTSILSQVTPKTYCIWKDAAKTEVIKFQEESMVDCDGVSDLELNDMIAIDPYLVRREQLQTVLSGDDLALLPRRLMAYALWERKFVHIDTHYLQKLATKNEDNPFDELEIDACHKKLIQSLVLSHFKKKEIESKGPGMLSQDVIRGKGKGVVILLHGVPGVGKTATAEAVAQKWGKPLFPITCGDLGFTADSVETSLNEIFRLAHLWDCVLLLDEADVFITQRNKNDLQRNALVSVFLRMMEYYNGILFLTTNRPGVLDEAVKSRVHVNLRYGALGLPETKKIFESNLNRLALIEKHRSEATNTPELYIMRDEIVQFAEEHFKRNTDDIGRWNGRQIRNAFSVAASLAHFSAENNPGLQPSLRVEHFREVENATRLYDEYRASVIGKTDGENAAELVHRNDGFDESEMGQHGIRRVSTIPRPPPQFNPTSYERSSHYAQPMAYPPPAPHTREFDPSPVHSAAPPFGSYATRDRVPEDDYHPGPRDIPRRGDYSSPRDGAPSDRAGGFHPGSYRGNVPPQWPPQQ